MVHALSVRGQKHTVSSSLEPLPATNAWRLANLTAASLNKVVPTLHVAVVCCQYVLLFPQALWHYLRTMSLVMPMFPLPHNLPHTNIPHLPIILLDQFRPNRWNAQPCSHFQLPQLFSPSNQTLSSISFPKTTVTTLPIQTGSRNSSAFYLCLVAVLVMPIPCFLNLRTMKRVKTSQMTLTLSPKTWTLRLPANQRDLRTSSFQLIYLRLHGNQWTRSQPPSLWWKRVRASISLFTPMWRTQNPHMTPQLVVHFVLMLHDFNHSSYAHM